MSSGRLILKSGCSPALPVSASPAIAEYHAPPKPQAKGDISTLQRRGHFCFALTCPTNHLTRLPASDKCRILQKEQRWLTSKSQAVPNRLLPLGARHPHPRRNRLLQRLLRRNQRLRRRMPLHPKLRRSWRRHRSEERRVGEEGRSP